MSQHGCPERLSNRSKGFQEDGPSQPTMEVMVETLTGTAFEMTVSPSDTIFAIKSRIFRVEGIPVSQQHLLYNLRELDDGLSLREHAIGDGARLRLVLGLRGGPMATRRLPPPEPWRDIERLMHSHRDEGEWGGASGGSGCKVTVLVFREGERVNMVRVRENTDGSYSPLERPERAERLERPDYSTSLSNLLEAEPEELTGSLQENAVTMGKMMDLRRRMENLSVQRRCSNRPGDKHDIQKTRSEETLSVPSLLDEPTDCFGNRTYAPYSEAEDTFAPLYDGNYTRYDYDCSFSDRYTLLPPIGARTDSEQSIQDDDRLKLSDALAGAILVKARDGREEDGAILEECLDADECIRQDSTQAAKNITSVTPIEYGAAGGAEGGGAGGGAGAWRAFGSSSALAPPPLAHALFSSSTSDLEALRRNRILPALSRHRNREHLHLSDEGLDLPAAGSLVVGSERRRAGAGAVTGTGVGATGAGDKKLRVRCGFCRKRLSIATVHRCRCGAPFCAPHRYAEVHGCAYDYKRPPPPLTPAPALPKI